jgi:hypothetical protein
MLKLNIMIEEKTADRLQTRLEYIAQQVGIGYLAGEGWDIAGEQEEPNENDE